MAELAPQVEERIATVEAAYAAANVDLGGRMWQTDAVKAALAAIHGLRARLDSWAKTGRASASLGKAPEGRGWPGWIAAGQILADGIHDIHAEGERATLANLAVTAATVVDDAKKAPRRLAKAVGETVAEVAKPLNTTLIIVAVGLLAVAAIVLGRR